MRCESNVSTALKSLGMARRENGDDIRRQCVEKKLFFSGESRAADGDLCIGGQIPAQRLGHGCGFRDADAELEISADAHVACADGFQPLSVEFALRQHEGRSC